MSEGRGWLRCAMIGVAAFVGVKTGFVLLTGVGMPVGELLDRLYGHLDRRAREQAHSVHRRIDEALASLAHGRDSGTIESARLTTEQLFASFGLSDAEFTALDLDPEKAASTVLSHATFTSDEQHEVAPLCRDLLVCFYRTLPENRELLASLLPHIYPVMLDRLSRLLTTHDAHVRQYKAILAALNAQGVPLPTLCSILEGFGEQLDQLDAGTIEAKLRAKAEEYRELSARLQRLTNVDPRVQALREQAKALIDRGDFAAADARLDEAKDLSLTAAAEAQQHYASLLETAAETEAERAAAASLRSDHLAAAAHWAEAARIIAPLGDAATWRYQLQEASALDNHGRERGDEASLHTAIGLYRDILARIPRAARRDDWATTQNKLGNALLVMGQRESGTVRLRKAVQAFCDALEERTRERVPLEWAGTQNNLGLALLTLGERESGTVRLRKAVQAFCDALEEFNRERMPLKWALTQNNLGGALLVWGQREGGTTRLDEAETACRDALKEFNRERVPLDWAATQNSLGTVLRSLGERESGTARLQEAVDAHRNALDEYTRERVPLYWAQSQHNLALALEALADRRNDPEELREAVACMRRAAEMYRAGGVDYWLLVAEESIARMEEKLAQRTAVAADPSDTEP